MLRTHLPTNNLRGFNMRQKLNGYYNYTVILTYLGMLSGFAGIAFVIEGCYREALLGMMIAGFCDMFDGTVAATRKRTDNEKRFGIQIDSLSDLICFGVLPALIAYCACGKTIIGLIVSSLYALCALIRLAYFNVLEEERQTQEEGCRTSYQGLPVTSSAVLLPCLHLISLWLPRGSSAFMLIAVAAIALAFVLPFKVRKPHMLGKIVLALLGVAELVLLVINAGPKV